MKSTKFWICLFISVVLICAAAAAFMHPQGFGLRPGDERGGSEAYIYSGGRLVETIDLRNVSGRYIITVSASHDTADNENAGKNVIEVENRRIRVLDSDCRGRDCVRQGWLSGGAVPIVCLPNNLLIIIESNTDIDAVTG